MPLSTRGGGSATEVWDIVRRKWLKLTPEEHVRQLILQYLVTEMNYPASLMAVERGLSLQHTTLRFDLAVYHRDTAMPWMLGECKSPDVDIDDAALQQLLQYHGRLPGVRFWLLSNGRQTYCADAIDPLKVKWLDSLPAY